MLQHCYLAANETNKAMKDYLEFYQDSYERTFRRGSDFSGSTSRMIEYVRNTDAPYYLLLTECTMGDNIIAENPRKEIVRLCSVRCPFMNEITLEDTLSALQKNQHVVEIPEEIRAPAKRALDRMMEIQ